MDERAPQARSFTSRPSNTFRRKTAPVFADCPVSPTNNAAKVMMTSSETAHRNGKTKQSFMIDRPALGWGDLHSNSMRGYFSHLTLFLASNSARYAPETTI